MRSILWKWNVQFDLSKHFKSTQREREMVQIFTTFVVFPHSSNRGCVNLYLFFLRIQKWLTFIYSNATAFPPLSMRKICSMKCQKVIKIVSLVWILILQKRVQFEWFSWGEERNVDMPMKRWTNTRENKWSSMYSFSKSFFSSSQIAVNLRLSFFLLISKVHSPNRNHREINLIG